MLLGLGAAALAGAASEPTAATKPWDSGYAPQAYNKGSRGQDARYNIRINCTKRADGRYVDRKGMVYGDDGLCLGGRSGNAVAGLKPADEMDGREPTEAYEYKGKKIGPDKENYPAESYAK